MKDNFTCPIPWISLSLGAQNKPRLCCHQETNSEYAEHTAEELIALKHNTNVRNSINNGNIPKECNHCIKLESNGCNSPRQDYLKRFTFDPSSHSNPIKYLDLTVDNECNLECIMCSPLYSHKLSRIFEKQFNMPPTQKWSTKLDIKQILQQTSFLEQVTITGGEPFISRKARSFIKELTDHPNVKNMVLRVFTNFTNFDSQLMEELKRFKRVELILSIDSVEENYELIRFPSKWGTITQNLEKLKNLSYSNIDIHLHSVITAVNWAKVGELIEFYNKNIFGYNIIPVFVEIDSPILHPRVLPENRYQEGLSSILASLEILKPRNEIQVKQIEDFKNLLKKIASSNFQDQYIDFKVYLQKIISYREKTANGSINDK